MLETNSTVEIVEINNNFKFWFIVFESQAQHKYK